VLGEQSSRSLLDRAPRILLAEDDDDLRWALAGALAAEGFAIEQVTTSNELLERLDGGVVTEDCMPDIVISDIRMPGFNAVNVIRGLRDAGCRTPVVFMSAFDDAHIAERLQAIDLVTYLRKPLRVRDLVDAVAIMIGTVSPQPPPGAPGP
jgi:two-component system OmpR family response regulator